MKLEEAKEGIRVYETEFGDEGTVIKVHRGDYPGCDVDFDNGVCTWIALEEIELLEEETK